jgi:hypothetical protein
MLALVTMAAAPVTAQTAAAVTGAGEAIFAGGATFNGIPLNGLTLGQGLSIAADGTAAGQFHTVLLGSSLLGAPRHIVVEGEVRAGSTTGNGANFNGTAMLDMGDGTLPVPGVPFTVTTSIDGVELTLDATALPRAALVAGSITIE